MTIETLDIGEPFFGLRMIEHEAGFDVKGRAIVLNLGSQRLRVEDQSIPPLSSVILQNARLQHIERAVVIERFDTHPDEMALMDEIRDLWPSAYDVRGEDRLAGAEYFMSPKARVGDVRLTFYHSASVPVHVGLHKDHPYCPIPGLREVHTQVVVPGKMQRCRTRSIDTLYLEEHLAPGTTHKPMFDAEGKYPWHQFETITPCVFLAVEMKPDAVAISA